MSTASIVAMLSIGVCGSIAERVLTSFGKTNEASFVGIATIGSLGGTALTVIIKLIQMLSTL